MTNRRSYGVKLLAFVPDSVSKCSRHVSNLVSRLATFICLWHVSGSFISKFAWISVCLAMVNLDWCHFLMKKKS